MSKIRRHSRIEDELPLEIREQVDRLLIEGGATYDDIRDWLAERGYDISRSAIGRYGQDFMGTYRRLRIIEDKARALVSEAGDGMALDEAVSKMFSQMILEALVAGDLDLKKQGRLIGDFAKLQSSTVQRERLKSELRKKAQAAAEEVAEVARKGGLSEDAIRQIEEQVLGITR
ncbi:MAG: phage protein Gp27 family protein [Syntrophobacteraceae bacterium]